MNTDKLITDYEQFRHKVFSTNFRPVTWRPRFNYLIYCGFALIMYIPNLVFIITAVLFDTSKSRKKNPSYSDRFITWMSPRYDFAKDALVTCTVVQNPQLETQLRKMADHLNPIYLWSFAEGAWFDNPEIRTLSRNSLLTLLNKGGEYRKPLRSEQIRCLVALVDPFHEENGQLAFAVLKRIVRYSGNEVAGRFYLLRDFTPKNDYQTALKDAGSVAYKEFRTRIEESISRRR